VAAPLARLVVAAPAEEAAEQVERVVPAAAAALPLLALLEPFVAVLVVDLAGLGVGEGFVGFGDEDEFVVGCWVVAGGRGGLDRGWRGGRQRQSLRVLVGVVFLAELPVGRLELLLGGLPVEAEDLVVVC
jgi:hypothetical protein